MSEDNVVPFRVVELTREEVETLAKAGAVRSAGEGEQPCFEPGLLPGNLIAEGDCLGEEYLKALERVRAEQEGPGLFGLSDAEERVTVQEQLSEIWQLLYEQVGLQREILEVLAEKLRRDD